MLHIIWIAVILTAVYLYFQQVYTKFSRHGVKNFTPIPPVGNMAQMLLRREHITELLDNMYKAFRNERFFGRYQFIDPILMIRDIELIKKITVKDYEYFVDRRGFVKEINDPVFGRSLLSLKGEEWKDMRSTLSPAFTSSKIRLMVPFMVEVGDHMMKALKTKIKESGVGYIDVEMKDLTTRYANDVIASCAFGLKVDSHQEPNNEFYVTGKATATFSPKQLLKLLGFSTFPKIMEILGIGLFSESSKSFFSKIILSTMQHREEKNIVRPDMIHLLMEAKKGKLTHEDKLTKDTDAGFSTVEESAVGKKNVNRNWSDNDLIAQAIVFFLAGFETVSTTMSFLFHELCVNPDVQNKLYQEIVENERNNGGKFDYNSIQNMTYMDMVISEVLRLWPPAAFIDRVCIKDYNIGKPNDKATKDYIVRKGDTVGVSLWSLHHDPEYFPNPNKFDPERFSEENKHNIKPFTYMPFGVGPRNCIGSRFALCEVKVMVYQLLQHMAVSVGARTRVPAQLTPGSFQSKIQGGHWIRMTPRH